MIIKKLKTWWQSRNYYVIADGNDNSITLPNACFSISKVRRKRAMQPKCLFSELPDKILSASPSIQISDNRLNYADIQYNDKYKCIGFESLCPSVGLMLYEHGLPVIV